MSPLQKAVVMADRDISAVRLQAEDSRTAEQKQKRKYDDELNARWKDKVIHGRYPAELENYGSRQTGITQLVNRRFPLP